MFFFPQIKIFIGIFPDLFFFPSKKIFVWRHSSFALQHLYSSLVTEETVFAGDSLLNIKTLDSTVTVDDYVNEHIKLSDQHGKEDAFYVVNLGDVVRKHQTWREKLPRIEPFYGERWESSRLYSLDNLTRHINNIRQVLRFHQNIIKSARWVDWFDLSANVEWLNLWLIVWIIDWSLDWFDFLIANTHWLIDLMVDWAIDWLIDWFDWLDISIAAVKCNDDPAVLQTLATLGTGFDCASKAEISKVLTLGVEPERIIYAHPCKTASHIRFAAETAVRKTTFDNEPELHKIKQLHPGAQLVLRIRADDPKAICNLGIKFGAKLPEAKRLLGVAQALGLDVIGVSFHVGSGCTNADAYGKAISWAREVFDHAASIGMNLTLLDIGGGFPGQRGAAITFDEVRFSSCRKLPFSSYCSGHYSFSRLIDLFRLSGFDWLIDLFMCPVSIDWLIDWLVQVVRVWLIDWFCWFSDAWFISRFIDWVVWYSALLFGPLFIKSSLANSCLLLLVDCRRSESGLGEALSARDRYPDHCWAGSVFRRVSVHPRRQHCGQTCHRRWAGEITGFLFFPSSKFPL